MKLVFFWSTLVKPLLEKNLAANTLLKISFPGKMAE
jgi:hypothetical protein